MWVILGERGWVGDYFGWVGVSGALFWVCGALFWVSGGGWGWVHCLVMPIVTTKKKIPRVLLLDVVRHAQTLQDLLEVFLGDMRCKDSLK